MARHLSIYSVLFVIFEILIIELFLLLLCIYFSHNLYLRKINRMMVSGSPMSCWNKSVYLHTVVKNEEASTYQELDLSENAYQNTTIR